MKIILIILNIFVSLLPLPLIVSKLEYNYDNYSSYSRFDISDYDKLEKLRTLNNYSYLETINHYYTSNFTKANFPSKELVLVNKFFKSELIEESELVNIDNYKITYPSIIKTTKDNILIEKIVIESYINMISDLNETYPSLSNLYIFSGYRDFAYQENIYNNSNDKSYVAKSKYSEHHTALALDISTLYYGLTSFFEDSEEFKILSNHAYKYGFILRYLKDKTDITGYSYEPWHFRYVGKIHSEYIYKNNLTLEEYLFQNFELV